VRPGFLQRGSLSLVKQSLQIAAEEDAVADEVRTRLRVRLDMGRIERRGARARIRADRER